MLGKSLKNTGVQVVGKAITVLISLVTTAILVRKLGTVNYGLFTLVTAVLILLDSLADFGTRVIGVREAAKDVSNHPGIFKNLVVLRLVMASGAMMIGLVWLLVYPGISDIRNEILLALLMSGFTSLAGSLEIIFQSKMRLDLKTLMDVAFPGLFLIFLSVVKNNLVGDCPGMNLPLKRLFVFSILERPETIIGFPSSAFRLYAKSRARAFIFPDRLKILLSGLGPSATPPPTKRLALRLPWRAPPVPFCL